MFEQRYCNIATIFTIWPKVIGRLELWEKRPQHDSWGRHYELCSSKDTLILLPHNLVESYSSLVDVENTALQRDGDSFGPVPCF